jgi:hypothetical protein
VDGSYTVKSGRVGTSGEVSRVNGRCSPCLALGPELEVAGERPVLLLGELAVRADVALHRRLLLDLDLLVADQARVGLNGYVVVWIAEADRDPSRHAVRRTGGDDAAVAQRARQRHTAAATLGRRGDRHAVREARALAERFRRESPAHHRLLTGDATTSVMHLFVAGR